MDIRKAVGRTIQATAIAVVITASAGAVGIAYAADGQSNSWDRAWHDARLVAGAVTGSTAGIAINGN